MYPHPFFGRKKWGGGNITKMSACCVRLRCLFLLFFKRPIFDQSAGVVCFIVFRFIQNKGCFLASEYPSRPPQTGEKKQGPLLPVAKVVVGKL